MLINTPRRAIGFVAVLAVLVCSLFLCIDWLRKRDGIPQIEASVRADVASLEGSRTKLRSLTLGAITRTRTVKEGDMLSGFFVFAGRYNNLPVEVTVHWTRIPGGVRVDTVEGAGTTEAPVVLWSRP